MSAGNKLTTEELLALLFEEQNIGHFLQLNESSFLLSSQQYFSVRYGDHSI